MFADSVEIFNTFAALANSFFPMKTRLIPLFFFSLLFSFSQAQIAQGTWLADGSAGISRDLTQGGDNFTTGIAPRFGYFLTDDWMLELGLQYNYARSAQAQVLLETKGWTIAPGMRFYFPTQQTKLAPFLGLRGGYQKVVNQFSNSETEASLFFLNANVGLDYFVHQNIAVEATIGYQGLYPDNVQQDVHSILYNIGFQLFLPKRSENSGPVQSPIQRGAWIIGGSANSGLANIGESNDLFFSFTPSAGYFINDHLVVGSSFQLAFASENAIVNPEPFARYYFRSGTATLQPFAMAGFGTRFQFADDFSDSSFFGLNAMAGAGVDFFIVPNFALEGVLRYDARQIEQANTRESLRLQFGFQLFLNAN